MARFRVGSIIVAVVALVAGLFGGSAWGENNFGDIGGNNHSDSIDAIATAGITLGCNPDGTLYCPANTVRRDQMASFLARAMGLSNGDTKNFPKANGRSEIQSYCALATANPRSFDAHHCNARAGYLSDPSPQRPSVGIGIDGFPIVAYRRSTGRLRVAHCNDRGCLASTVTDTDISTAGPPSLALRADGMVGFAYSFITADGPILFLTTCGGTCSVVSNFVVGGSGVPGGPAVALAYAPDGNPTIAYRDQSDDKVKLLHCTDRNCGGHTAPAVLSVAVAGPGEPSIAIGTDGFPVVSFRSGDSNVLQVTRCLNDSCSDSQFQFVNPAATIADGTSIAIGINGFPIISFHDVSSNTLNVTRCGDASCNPSAPNHVTTTVANTAGAGFRSTVKIGTSGFPIIAHTLPQSAPGTHRLYLTRCTNATCSASTTETLADPVNASETSMAIGLDGVPVLATVIPFYVILPRPRIS